MFFHPSGVRRREGEEKHPIECWEREGEGLAPAAEDKREEEKGTTGERSWMPGSSVAREVEEMELLVSTGSEKEPVPNGCVATA